MNTAPRKEWINRSSYLLSGLSLLFSSAAMAEFPQGAFIETCEALYGYGSSGSAAPDRPTVAQTNLKTLCNSDNGIIRLSDAEDNTAVAALRHEEVALQGTLALRSAASQTDNVRERMAEIRKVPVQQNWHRTSRNTFFINGSANNSQGDATNDAAGFGSGITGDVRFTDPLRAAIVQGQRAFEADGQHLTLGMDRRLDDKQSLVGAAVGIGKQDGKFTDQTALDDNGNTLNGGVKAQGVYASAYATRMLSDAAYLDAVVTLGSSDLTVTRPVPKANAAGNGRADTYATAVGKPNSTVAALSVGAGYDTQHRGVIVTPYSRVDYTRLSIDAYEETVPENALGTKLRVAGQDVDSLLGSVGVKISKPIWMKKGILVTPDASMEIGHEFANDARDITATLPAADGLTGVGSAVVRTSDPERNQVKLGVGVSARFAKDRFGSLQVNALRGNDQNTDTAIQAGYRMGF